MKSASGQINIHTVIDLISEHPLISGHPLISEHPLISGHPLISEHPLISGHPLISEHPHFLLVEIITLLRPIVFHAN